MRNAQHRINQQTWSKNKGQANPSLKVATHSGVDQKGEKFWGAYLTYSRKRTCEDAVPWQETCFKPG